jgi:hypothetical protein
VPPEVAAARVRRLALLSGLLALGCLGMAIWQNARGAILPWTSWALPTLLLMNALLSVFDVTRRHPRSARWSAVISVGVSAAIIVALLASPR